MLLFIGVFIGVFLVWPPVFIGVFLVWPPTAGWERKHPRISEVQATGRLRNWEFFASAEIPTLSNFANSLSHRLTFAHARFQIGEKTSGGRNDVLFNWANVPAMGGQLVKSVPLVVSAQLHFCAVRNLGMKKKMSPCSPLFPFFLLFSSFFPPFSSFFPVFLLFFLICFIFFHIFSFVSHFPFRVCGFAGLRVYGFTGLRVCRFAGLRVCGFAGLRVYGFAGLRVCGFAGLQVCRFAGLRF